MNEQIFQVGIKGLIRNDHGEVLMVHLTPTSNRQAIWDLPGGRMNPNENLLQTLNRELNEEIGVGFIDKPKLLSAFVSEITITVNDQQLPLLLIIYRAAIAPGAVIKLDPNSNEDSYNWFSPVQAAENLKDKFSPEFCELVARL